MSQEAVFEILGHIAQADATSYWIVAGLTALVFAVMRAMLPVKGLAFVLAPAVFWGGLSGIYALTTWGVHFTSERHANVVLSGVIGMVAALVVMIVLLRILEAVFRIRRPLTRTPQPTLAPRRVRI
jgi:hypothetical protein